MLKKIKILLISLTVMLIGLFYDTEVLATDDGAGFSITPVIPSTQLDMSKSFFYLQTKPGEEQELQVHVVSNSTEPVDIEVLIQNAISTEEGVIDYKEPLIKNDTLENSIEEILTTEEKTFTIEPNDYKTVTFKLKPPTTHYDGIKAGSILFRAKEKGKADQAQMVDIYNGYRTGIIISESGDPFNDGQTLELIDVKPTLSRGRKVVEAAVSNPEPKTVENLTIKAKMIEKKSGKVIKEENVQNYTFAPNSTMPFTFDWGLSNLIAGTYILKMDISNDETQWNLEKEFKLTENQVKKVNDESPFRIITPTWIKLSTVILGVITILINIMLFIRNKKWKNQSKKSKKRRNQSKSKKRRR